jgi:hypothetical protein
MKAVGILTLAVAIVTALAGMAAAQQPAPLPHGPAALSVPHPIPPIFTSPRPPRDLYQQLTPPSSPTTVFVPGFVYGPYGPFGPSAFFGSGYVASQTGAPGPTVLRVPQGTLRFESSPSDAQVYVDGAYLGVTDDFGMLGRRLLLDEGLHRVELRAPGYAPLSFVVNIAADQTIRYRGDLQRLSPLPTPAPVVSLPAAPAKTTYVIPHCYAGDRPPTRALPHGCDASKMVVRKP